MPVTPTIHQTTTHRLAANAGHYQQAHVTRLLRPALITARSHLGMITTLGLDPRHVTPTYADVILPDTALTVFRNGTTHVTRGTGQLRLFYTPGDPEMAASVAMMAPEAMERAAAHVVPTADVDMDAGPTASSTQNSGTQSRSTPAFTISITTPAIYLDSTVAPAGRDNIFYLRTSETRDPSVPIAHNDARLKELHFPTAEEIQRAGFNPNQVVYLSDVVRYFQGVAELEEGVQVPRELIGGWELTQEFGTPRARYPVLESLFHSFITQFPRSVLREIVVEGARIRQTTSPSHFRPTHVPSRPVTPAITSLNSEQAGSSHSRPPSYIPSPPSIESYFPLTYPSVSTPPTVPSSSAPDLPRPSSSTTSSTTRPLPDVPVTPHVYYLSSPSMSRLASSLFTDPKTVALEAAPDSPSSPPLPSLPPRGAKSNSEPCCVLPYPHTHPWLDAQPTEHELRRHSSTLSKPSSLREVITAQDIQDIREALPEQAASPPPVPTSNNSAVSLNLGSSSSTSDPSSSSDDEGWYYPPAPQRLPRLEIPQWKHQEPAAVDTGSNTPELDIEMSTPDSPPPLVSPDGLSYCSSTSSRSQSPETRNQDENDRQASRMSAEIETSRPKTASTSPTPPESSEIGMRKATPPSPITIPPPNSSSISLLTSPPPSRDPRRNLRRQLAVSAIVSPTEADSTSSPPTLVASPEPMTTEPDVPTQPSQSQGPASRIASTPADVVPPDVRFRNLAEWEIPRTQEELLAEEEFAQALRHLQRLFREAASFRPSQRFRYRNTFDLESFVTPEDFHVFFSSEYSTYDELLRELSPIPHRPHGRRPVNRWLREANLILQIRRAVLRLISTAHSLVHAHGYSSLQEYRESRGSSSTGRLFETSPLLHFSESRTLYTIVSFLREHQWHIYARMLSSTLHTRFEAPRDLWTLVHVVMDRLVSPKITMSRDCYPESQQNNEPNAMEQQDQN